MAAKADDARRERLARAVREKGKDKVDDGEDDALCVICLGPPVDPIQVRYFVGARVSFVWRVSIESSSSTKTNSEFAF